jgi:L-ribulose-5-phosphate 3-epimerase
MNRRNLLKTFSALAGFAEYVRAQDQGTQQAGRGRGGRGGRGGPSMPIPPATKPVAYPGRLKPGVVAMTFRGELESGQMTYEDLVREAAEYGLQGLDLTGYYLPPLLKFPPGIASQVVSEMVRQTPANPSNEWLASMRSTAYKNAVHIYTIGTPVKMSHETPELRAKEVAFGKKWIDIADRLGAGMVRVFAGSIPKGATEEQAVAWAVEVYKPLLDYGAEKGIFVAVEDDDELTRSADQILNIIKLAGNHPFARVNIDCGNFRKDGYNDVAKCAHLAHSTHIKTAMATPDGGREAANWEKLFGILANNGFRGYVSMEIETNDKPMPKFAAEEIRVARMFSGMPEPV